MTKMSAKKEALYKGWADALGKSVRSLTDAERMAALMNDFLRRAQAKQASLSDD